MLKLIFFVSSCLWLIASAMQYFNGDYVSAKVNFSLCLASYACYMAGMDQ